MIHVLPYPCRFKKQQGGDALQAFPMFLGSDIGSDIGSDGWPGILQLKIKGADGVRSVYEMFMKVPGLDAKAAPLLWAYLGEERPTEIVGAGGYTFSRSNVAQLLQSMGTPGQELSPEEGGS